LEYKTGRKTREDRVKMRIEILGTGCPKCKKLEENAVKAVEELEHVEVVKVEDMDKILSYGVMMTPALAIDGKVVSSGKVADVEEIEKLIERAKKWGRGRN